MSSTSTAHPFRALVFGGGGNFGRRICAALAQYPAIDVIAAGRRSSKGKALQDLHYLQLDAHSDLLANDLCREEIDLVINTVGPFTAGGYGVAEAALLAGAHYLDLSDQRAHVCGIDRWDNAAKAANVCLISGASSVPALTGAVVDAYATRFSHLQRVECAISASELTPGDAAVASVLGNVGKPYTFLRAGNWTTTTGWSQWHHFRFAPPLGRRWVADVNVPDLELLPTRYPTLDTVTFKAGVAMLPSMIGTGLVAQLVKHGWSANAAAYAKTLARLARGLHPFGSGRSGMYVVLRGMDHDRVATTLTWQLIAQNNDGPWVPCTPAVVLAKLLEQKKLTSGAYPCVGILSLATLLEAFDGLNIETHLDINHG